MKRHGNPPSKRLSWKEVAEAFRVRADEAKELKEKGYAPVLTKSRWLLLKRAENLTSSQETKLADLLQYNLRSIRSYLLKEAFQRFWSYQSPYWAGEFLDI